ncbi:MAG: hypoxanthine phosphoribosyltransferase [Candidatus Azobacteroides sp.]|nr:hypoxanthine phosphoribosyltransferase [Candidatus Azobacteroides sp.]
MSEQIKIKDKTFKLSIPEEEINAAIDRIASRMHEELKEKDPLFIAILNGSFMFASELMKRLNIPSQISFVRVQSYNGLETTQKYKEIFGLTEDIAGKTVVIIEDIIDSGFTMQNILKILEEKNPREIKVATLLHKPDATQCEVPLDYVALTIPNDFIVGFGLDYDGYGRNFKNIYSIV